MNKQHPPAWGLKKLTLAQITEIDNLAIELSQITQNTGREAELIIKFIKGNPRVITKSISTTFNPGTTQINTP